ncbi:hypothetical protein MferCBS49748_004550 [Microsporum ferrugineum]
MVLEFAAEGKVEEIEGLDFIGPKNWRKKLADSKERLRTHEGYCESLFYTTPEWPKVRGRLPPPAPDNAPAGGARGHDAAPADPPAARNENHNQIGQRLYFVVL